MHPRFSPFTLRYHEKDTNKAIAFNSKGERAYTFKLKDLTLEKEGTNFDLNDPVTYSTICTLTPMLLWSDLQEAIGSNSTASIPNDGPYKIVLNRDKTKRPVMAKIATQFSDKVILTSDNPRDEEPMAILREMEAGINPVDFKKTLVIEDRREAIKTAAVMAKKGDIILVAGKGHETYQEIKGVKYPFDDRQVVAELLNLLNKD